MTILGLTVDSLILNGLRGTFYQEALICMIKILFSFLCLVLFSFPTIAQQSCQGKVIPWKASIAGYTDSITVEAIVTAGKIKCSNQAFEIINFKIGIINLLGCFTEVSCTSDSLSTLAIDYIQRLTPGLRLYLDCVQVKNKVGEVYQLTPAMLKICARLPGQPVTK